MYVFLMIPLTTLYDEYIDGQNFLNKKNQFSF